MRGLIWLILGGVLYWALRGLFRKGEPEGGAAKGSGEEMVRDPQCGVYIPLSEALKTKARGETLYFCSTECEEKYRESSGV